MNGKLQEDLITTPTFAEVNSMLRECHDDLDKLSMYHSTRPLVKENNYFYGYLVCTKSIDTIKLAYCKVFVGRPESSNVIMAYKTAQNQGSCDDGEHKAGYKMLRLLQRKKLKNCAVFMARVSGQHLGPKRFKYILEVAEELIDSVIALPIGNPQNPLTDGAVATPPSPQANTG